MTLRPGRRFWGVVRASAWLSIALGVVGAFGARAAKAEAGNAGLTLGRTLLPLLELESEKTSLKLNGEDLFVSSVIVDRSVSSVLDAFEAQCNDKSGPLADAWPKAARDGFATSKRGGILPSLPRVDVFRRDSSGGSGDGEGVVFCFVDGSRGHRSFTEAAHEFARDRDLGAFGELRYAYVKGVRDDHGGAVTKSRVIATWTGGRFRVGGSDARGDAFGSDPEAAPRPPDSKRLLSAALIGTPYGMYAYSSAKTPRQVLGFYDAELGRARWTRIVDPAADGENGGHAYERDGAQIFVAAVNEVDGDAAPRTLVSIGELGVSGSRK